MKRQNIHCMTCPFNNQESMIARIIAPHEKMVGCNVNTAGMVLESANALPFRVHGVKDIIARDSRHTIIYLSAGKNGPGNWLDYLDDLKSLFVNLNRYFDDAWLVKIDNDVKDDVHDIFIGVTKKESHHA